ncbi:NAD-dependent epimerase/dehydratase family protein [Polaromonas sp.]|uniref:NAD-dependent epimerase/dehydratase family protein n=1 Tax=Polaromonas sp. TaxID=1869339 RepID=UPI003CB38F60
MNIFIAGGSGAIGRQLVPMLVQAGHRVVAMTRSQEGAVLLDAMGALPVVGNVFDKEGLARMVEQAKPDIVIHQLTAFGAKDADPLAETIRVRTEGTRNLIAAAEKSTASRFITQSISFICTPVKSGLTDESTPLYLDAPLAIQPLAHAVAEMETRTVHCNGLEGIVLRYGWFYGPGTNYDPSDAIPLAIKKGRMPIVGGGDGIYSFVHVHDAAVATMKALTHGEPGIYNIVDDAPAKLSEWLPFVANLLDAPAPAHMDEALAREKLGDMLVYIFNEQSGASNLKAKKALSWAPAPSSWRAGFKSLYASVDAKPAPNK